MNDTYSEVLELYAQAAIDAGLISEAQEETNPRYDTHDMKAIEILYGVQPNGEKDDILDKAHPKPAIVAPAYDRVNALVENLKERQNVMADIARKPNDGKHTQERYVKAQRELFREFKKATLLLERKNEDSNLIRLADKCSEQIVKESLLFLVPTAAAIWGGVRAVEEIMESMEENTVGAAAGNAEEKLGDLIEDGEGAFDQFSDLLESISSLREASEKVSELDVTGVGAPKSKEQAEQAVNSAVSLEKQKAFQIIDYYRKVMSVISRALPKYIKLLKVMDAEAGGQSWWATVGRWIYETDLPDAIESLEILSNALRTTTKIMSQKRRLIEHFAKEGNLTDDIKKLEKEYEIGEKPWEETSTLPGPTPTQTPTPTPTPTPPKPDASRMFPGIE